MTSEIYLISNHKNSSQIIRYRFVTNIVNYTRASQSFLIIFHLLNLIWSWFWFDLLNLLKNWSQTTPTEYLNSAWVIRMACAWIFLLFHTFFLLFCTCLYVHIHAAAVLTRKRDSCLLKRREQDSNASEKFKVIYSPKQQSLESKHSFASSTPVTALCMIA